MRDRARAALAQQRGVARRPRSRGTVGAERDRDQHLAREQARARDPRAPLLGQARAGPARAMKRLGRTCRRRPEGGDLERSRCRPAACRRAARARAPNSASADAARSARRALGRARRARRTPASSASGSAARALVEARCCAAGRARRRRSARRRPRPRGRRRRRRRTCRCWRCRQLAKASAISAEEAERDDHAELGLEERCGRTGASARVPGWSRGRAARRRRSSARFIRHAALAATVERGFAASWKRAF